LIYFGAFKAFGAVAFSTLPAELPVMDVLAAMTEHAVTGGFQFPPGTGFMAIVAAKFLMRPVYLEICLPVMLKQPVLP
jgi:hypothetical protein